MKESIKSRLLSGKEVIMRIPTTSLNMKGWLAIYPINVEDLASFPALMNEYEQNIELPIQKGWAFRILSFEIPIEYIENAWDVSEENKGSVPFFQI